MRFFLAALALLLVPSASRAEWFEASSAHFVVYADDSERDIRKFSEQLERSFAERGVPPTENATQALERAVELAPFDLFLRFYLATQQLQAGRIEDARRNFLPIAYSPHGGPLAEGVRAVIDRIDHGAPPDAAELARILGAGGATPGEAGPN